MQTQYDVDMQLDVKVPMRDGVALSADIYLPRAHGKFPTVLMRTPYSNNTEQLIEKGRRLANNGYACAIQDCRWRWDSDGDYYPLRTEGADGCMQSGSDRQEHLAVGYPHFVNRQIAVAVQLFAALLEIVPPRVEWTGNDRTLDLGSFHWPLRVRTERIKGV